MSSSSETPPRNQTRELAAIMFSDIAGYTLIMGRDERTAIRALDEHRELLRGLLPKFNGRMLGEIGDGTLSSFHSAVDAVNCAREVQATLMDDPELRLRIGIHVGDVLFANNTVLGDGVNVASRIHALAPPGGICISERVYDEIRNQPGLPVEDLGEQTLKNVSRPIRIYALDLSGAPSQPSTSVASAAIAKNLRIGRRTVVVASAAGLLFAGLIYGALNRRVFVTNISSVLRQSTTHGRIRSLAVLPLVNLSGDPGQEYFADGMTEELITDLAKISALRVISHTSVMQFKGERRKSLPDIARMLNVDAVVEGSVLRVGGKVRINAQLIDGPADKHLWAQSYERNSRDVLALQGDLASAIAHEIDVHLTPIERANLSNARAVNPAAHEAYLKGVYYWHQWTEDGYRKSADYLEQAVKADPESAEAYAALARTYADAAETFLSSAIAMPKAQAAALKALELDPSNAEALTVLGVVKFEYDFDWEGAEREFQRAIAANPRYAEAHHHYGYFLWIRGRADESIAQMEQAREFDPLAPAIAGDVVAPLLLHKQFDEATRQAQQLVDMNPQHWEGHFWVGFIEQARGRPKAAVPEMEKVRALFPSPYSAGVLGYAYAIAGNRDGARKLLDELYNESKVRYVSPFYTSWVHLGLGEKDQALKQLEKAYDQRATRWLLQIKGPMFDPLRSDPRFIDLFHKIRLDQ
jgi:adenylate cyclase